MTMYTKDQKGDLFCPECQLTLLLSHIPDPFGKERAYNPDDVKTFVIQNKSKLSLLVHTIWRREEQRIKDEAKALKEQTQREKRYTARLKKLAAAREGVMVEGFGCI